MENWRVVSLENEDRSFQIEVGNQSQFELTALLFDLFYLVKADRGTCQLRFATDMSRNRF